METYRQGMRAALLAATLTFTLVGCTGADAAPEPAPSASTTPTEEFEPFETGIVGVVMGEAGPLADAWVTMGDEAVYTDASGSFEFSAVLPADVTVTRPGYEPTTVTLDGAEPVVDIELQHRTVRALRLSSAVAGSDDGFARMLALAEGSTVNAFVFDTKDETARVKYATEAPIAVEMGFISPAYDPVARIAQAKDAGLYTVTRIVTFNDANWAGKQPEHTLIGSWMNAHDRANWEYPLQLAEEACALGFDEVQFDYIRFPSGDEGRTSRKQQVLTQDERVADIRDFLAEATARLHPEGCAVSADIFGIVMSANDDQGLGQRPEELSLVTDALSPMLYPSHYGAGWGGFADPNANPGPIVAMALDSGMPRASGGAAMRPWLQAFYYDGAEVLAQINEAEARGAGWVLWNYNSEFDASWLPPERSDAPQG